MGARTDVARRTRRQALAVDARPVGAPEILDLPSGFRSEETRVEGRQRGVGERQLQVGAPPDPDLGGVIVELDAARLARAAGPAGARRRDG
jgi:hypothetical protein